MTANEIIFAIREKLKAYTDDTKYTDAYLMYLINLKRVSYIKQTYNQAQHIVDEEIMQTIVDELEEVDPSEAGLTFRTYDYVLMRTINKMPKFVNLHHKNMIHRVQTVGKIDRPMCLVSQRKAVYAGQGEYEKNINFAFLHNDGHIYIKSNDDYFRSIDAIAVVGVLTDPDDISRFQEYFNPDERYNFMEADYPLKGDMVDRTINEITQELANLQRLPSDTDNNAVDDNVLPNRISNASETR